MTSNYDKYIQPETWPIPVERVGSVHFGDRRLDGMTEIKVWSAVPDIRLYTLDVVPTNEEEEAVRAIVAYCQACRKLIG